MEVSHEEKMEMLKELRERRYPETIPPAPDEFTSKEFAEANDLTDNQARKILLADFEKGVYERRLYGNEFVYREVKDGDV